MIKLAALLLLSCLAHARAENFDQETREFVSKNRAFRASVGYSGRGGGGRARVDLRGAAGKKLARFVAEAPPFSVTISGDGRRLFFFCGSWGRAVSISALNVHAASGALLAAHRLDMRGTAGEDLSEDNSVYALGTSREGGWGVLVINAETGKALWSRKFGERLAGLKLSGNGEKLLLLFAPGEGQYRAAVFDRAGRELASAGIKTANNLRPRAFNRDGSALELWENRTVYDEKDGYWHAKVVRKRAYAVTDSGLKETASKEVYEDYR